MSGRCKWCGSSETCLDDGLSKGEDKVYKCLSCSAYTRQPAQSEVLDMDCPVCNPYMDDFPAELCERHMVKK